MDYGSIEREIHIDATPEVVYQVISTPEHLREWWPDDARFAPAPGSAGEIVFRGHGGDGRVGFTVVEVRPPHTFSFRWTHPVGEVAGEGNSLLVTFELTASGGGTLLRMTETGFRAMGWEAAVLEEQYREHATGWDFYLPRLVSYAPTLDPRP